MTLKYDVYKLNFQNVMCMCQYNTCVTDCYIKFKEESKCLFT